MQVRFTQAARGDIDDIWQFAVQRWGQWVAHAYIRDLGTSCDGLAQNPALGRAIDFVQPGYRKLPVRSHTVFYKIEGEAVIVVRILHQSRDVDSALG